MPTPMKFVGGVPCLDFVNTVGGWSSGRVLDDKLSSYSDLIRWAELAQMEITAPGRWDAKQAAQVLKRARTLRLALHRLLNSIVSKRNTSPADLSVFQTELARARKHQRLSIHRGPARWEWDDTRALDS